MPLWAGLTLLTDDFAATTQNTEPGVDVILSPVDDGTGTYAVKPTIGRQTQYVVEQVLESTGSIPIPEGKAVLTLNAKESEEALARLRALQPGDTVTLTVSSSDQRWSQAVQAWAGVSKLSPTAGGTPDWTPPAPLGPPSASRLTAL